MKKWIAILLTLVVLASSFYYASTRENGGVRVNSTEVRTTGETQDSSTKASPYSQDPVAANREQRLWYELPFALVKARAEQGDAEAQWQLSEMYNYCFMYSLKREATLAQFDLFAKTQSRAKGHASRIKKELTERCATVDDGKPIPTEAVTLWAEESARKGNLTAQLRISVLQSETDAKKLLGYAEAMRGAEPQAIFEMGSLVRLIEPHWKNPETHDAFSKGKHAEYAWQIAACRSGLDCSQGSTVMYWACYQGGCGYDSYEQFIVNARIPPDQRTQLEETIKMINDEFLN